MNSGFVAPGQVVGLAGLMQLLQNLTTSMATNALSLGDERLPKAGQPDLGPWEPVGFFERGTTGKPPVLRNLYMETIFVCFVCQGHHLLFFFF